MISRTKHYCIPWPVLNYPASFRIRKSLNSPDYSYTGKSTYITSCTYGRLCSFGVCCCLPDVHGPTKLQTRYVNRSADANSSCWWSYLLPNNPSVVNAWWSLVQITSHTAMSSRGSRAIAGKLSRKTLYTVAFPPQITQHQRQSTQCSTTRLPVEIIAMIVEIVSFLWWITRL